ncbi:MAG: hypothetical protein Q7J98_07095 [Kiritimatiellia bacterium]|nr:hypothetical protein [Kiritimatiellia bacterium]
MNIVYARYNRHRLPPFQIETSIVDLNGVKTVIKKALTPEAGNHILAIRSGYDLVQRNLNAGSLVLPRLTGFDGSSVSFQYIEGKSFDRLLFQSFRDRDRASFFKIIDDYHALLKKAFRLVERPEINAKISAVFGIKAGDHPDGSDWLPLAAIDAVFENIIVSGQSYYLIDNEWVFEGGVPLAFIVFRSLFYFHKVKYFEFGIEKWIKFEELLERCQILPEQASRYRAMDEWFQAYVYGPERCFRYKEQYKKREISVHQLEQTIAHQRAVVRKYHAAILQNERTINDIVNSFGWRLWQKIAFAINFLCPVGSRRRRIADRLISSLKSREKRVNGKNPHSV